MAKKTISILRKRRTREHVIADLSTNHVERQALLCGFSVERIRLDYGIDLIVHTYNRRGEIENGRILFQLKATSRLKVSSKTHSVVCRLHKADLLYWLGESMPVIVIQYDAENDIAYWLHVQEYCETVATFDPSGSNKQVTFSIGVSNVLDRAAMEQLAKKKNDLVTASMRGD